MSAQLCTASELGGNNAAIQGTTVPNSKPLHRFTKGQPKTVGVIVLVLGVSFFMKSITITGHDSVHHIWAAVRAGFLLGTLFIICGILYILTEHNPTKKTVTISLALSIVTILGICWTVIVIMPDIVHSHYYSQYEFQYNNLTEIEELTWTTSPVLVMALTVEAIFIFYTVVGAVILIVMSTLASAALHSNAQAVIVVSSPPSEVPID